MAGNDLERMLGSLLGGDGKDAGLLGALIGSLSHGQGGSSLGGLLDSLARSGLTAQQDSWVGTGTNQPVTAEQAGVSPRNAADRIAPEGEVPQASIEDLIRRRSG
ncbi:YidB family protein [Streptomyces sp. NPDC002763]|uniref:YidB family protein n=1 Tax=Streptomyces sp. NPDC002763 TaxID=3154427 RepID=UPI00332EA11E